MFSSLLQLYNGFTSGFTLTHFLSVDLRHRGIKYICSLDFFAVKISSTFVMKLNSYPYSPEKNSTAKQNLPTIDIPVPPTVADSFSLAGAPLGVWRMERGGESPITQDSPERMGGSPDLSSLPPPGKKGRLELNGSPTGPRIRHNGAPPRPQGGKQNTEQETGLEIDFRAPTLISCKWYVS